MGPLLYCWRINPVSDPSIPSSTMCRNPGSQGFEGPLCISLPSPWHLVKWKGFGMVGVEDEEKQTEKLVRN
jgi:hypothetical protein